MTIGPVIEVLIGLIFMFFVFSTLASGVNEYVSRRLHKRCLFLAHGVWQLLDDRPETKAEGASGDEFFQEFWKHPLVKQLGQSLDALPEWEKKIAKKATVVTRAARRIFTGAAARAANGETRDRLPKGQSLRTSPSYIPTATFVTVVTALVRSGTTADASSPLGRSLAALAADAGFEGGDPDDSEAVAKSLERYKANLARWFDNQMDRVSGWYKRESKTILFILGLVIVAAMNVDTIVVARTLWKDPTTRQLVQDAAAAQLAAQTATSAPATTATTVEGTPPAVAPVIRLACKKASAVGPSPTTTATVATTTTTPEDTIRTALDCATVFPIGWRTSKTCYVNRRGAPEVCSGRWDRVQDVWFSIVRRPFGALLKLMGLLITAGAITYGAPFWFDMLNRFANLRSTGAKPPPASAATSSPTK